MKHPEKAKNRKGAKKAKNACFKLYGEDTTKLRKIARHEKVSISEAVRGAIREQHARLFTPENK